jgi:hypothetical protein
MDTFNARRAKLYRATVFSKEVWEVAVRMGRSESDCSSDRRSLSSPARLCRQFLSYRGRKVLSVAPSSSVRGASAPPSGTCSSGRNARLQRPVVWFELVGLRSEGLFQTQRTPAALAGNHRRQPAWLPRKDGYHPTQRQRSLWHPATAAAFPEAGTGRPWTAPG